MVRKQQLFSVLGEIVPYKKFKKRGGEPFFTCILGGANHFLHLFQGGANHFLHLFQGGARRFLTIIFNVLPRTCLSTIAPSLIKKFIFRCLKYVPGFTFEPGAHLGTWGNAFRHISERQMDTTLAQANQVFV